MSINFSMAEDFSQKSIKTFQELNVFNISTNQDFEGIGPDEKYWGVLKINEDGGVILNLQGAPISKLTSWTMNIRFKKAADGRKPENGNVAYFGILNQPFSDSPDIIDVTSSICAIYCGKDNSFGVVNGTLESFRSVNAYFPPSILSYEPYVTEDGKLSKDAEVQNTNSDGIFSSTGLSSTSSKDFFNKLITSANSTANGVISAAGQAALTAVNSAISTASTQLASLGSKVGFVTGALSSMVTPDTLKDLTSKVDSLKSSASSILGSASGNTKSSILSSVSSLPGGISNVTPNMCKFNVSSPELVSKAKEVSTANLSTPAVAPEVAESPTSGPFFSLVLTYAESKLTAVVDGQQFATLDVPAEVIQNLGKKPYVIGCVTSAMRIQLDSLSFSGNG